MLLRQEKQEYADVAALVAETLVPTNNDTVYVEALRRTFDWIEGSTATHDGTYVIDQTNTTALGRWQASSAANIFTGTANTDELDNGQVSAFNVTVTGVSPASAHAIAITNADTFPVNVFVTSKDIIAANTVRITIVNESGIDNVAPFAVNVTVLEF